ncbi:thiamine phosphate synthase [Kurthia huakuii]|uniref:thiamine phosphate synthase n=1 Tax=Kurthia huakuii TaxID=1421019 RepID=UPI000494DE7B
MKVFAVIPDGLSSAKIEEIVEAVIARIDDFDYVCIRQQWHSETLLRYLLTCNVKKEKIILYGNIELAVNYDVAGVHFLAHDDRLEAFKQQYPHKLVGQSIHTLEEFQCVSNADYFIVGPVYQSFSQPTKEPIGEVVLQKICNSTSVPVIAIGGMTEEKKVLLESIGAAGIAVSTSFFQLPLLHNFKK